MAGSHARPTCAPDETCLGRAMLSQPGPIRRRLSISDSSSDWLVPKTVLKVMPASPAGNAGWVAGYFTCKNTGWGEVKARVEDKFYTSPAQPSPAAWHAFSGGRQAPYPQRPSQCGHAP